MTLDTILARGAKRLDGSLRNDPRTHAKLVGIIGRTYTDLGDYSKAETMLRAARAESIKAWGADNIETADITRTLAYALFEQGKFDRAMPLYQSVLAAYRKAGPGYREQLADALVFYAQLLRQNGRSHPAEKTIREALALYNAIGVKPVWRSTDTLGMILVDENRLDEAVALERRVLHDELTHHGADRGETANTMTYLAAALQHQGKLPEAATTGSQS